MAKVRLRAGPKKAPPAKPKPGCWFCDRVKPYYGPDVTLEALHQAHLVEIDRSYTRLRMKYGNPNRKEVRDTSLDHLLSKVESAAPVQVQNAAAQPGKLDPWGFKAGSGAALINSVLTTEYQTAAQIESRSNCGRKPHGQLVKMSSLGYVEGDKAKGYRLTPKGASKKTGKNQK